MVSERAVKVLQKDPNEAVNYKEEDLIMLNPSGSEIDDQTVKMTDRRTILKAQRKAAKAAKKASKGEEAKDTSFKMPLAPGSMCDDQSLTDEPLAKKSKTDGDISAAFKDQGKGKKSKKEPEESRAGSKGKVFNPFAAMKAKEVKQDARPEREGPKVRWLNIHGTQSAVRCCTSLEYKYDFNSKFCRLSIL